MHIDDLAQAPDPQFYRPGWTDLTGDWRFRFDPADQGDRERWFRNPDALDKTIQVPFAPETPLSGIGDKGYNRLLWYSRTFGDTRQSKTERLLLRFGAVDYQATVWVNGELVGTHEGGHTPFAFDVTDALEPGGGENTIVVRVVDDPVDIEQPRGKQAWEEGPHKIWYHRTSGIWQTVWTEVVPRIHVERVCWQFNPQRHSLDFEIELNSSPAPETMVSVTAHYTGSPLVDTSIAALSRSVAGSLCLAELPDALELTDLLWSLEHPELVNLTVNLQSTHGTDTVGSYTGLREVRLDGSRFLINGEPVYLRMVLNQGYWPDGHLTAPQPELLKQDVELMLALGFNGARMHQKIEDPRFLYWADRLGLLLWAEMPSAFAHSERAIRRHRDEWDAAVRRDRNHPSIIAWVPFNESWGIGALDSSKAQRDAVRAAYYATHALDGSRPVIGNDGWENLIGDVFTIHDYEWDVDILRKRYADEAGLEWTMATHSPEQRSLAIDGFHHHNLPIMVTEFGGVSFCPDAEELWFGYGSVTTDKQFVDAYRDMISAVGSSRMLCGFCYTQFTDTLQETNGLLNERREPKVPIEILSRITRGLDVSLPRPEPLQELPVATAAVAP